jgi:hypothetical protein
MSMGHISPSIFASLPRWRYDGDADRPAPPMQGGWSETPWGDWHARGAATSLLGELPLYEYTDVVLENGRLYRFFAFETAMGATAIGGMHWAADDDAGMLGQEASVNPALDRAQNDLNTQFQGVNAVTQSYIAGSPPDYPTAVQALQAIGNAAVSSTGVGGEIFAAAPDQKPLTDQAWQLNAQLAAVPQANASATDAANAEAIITRMFALYQQAINNARAAPPPAPAPPMTTAPSAALVQAAQTLYSWLQTHGCQPRFVQEVHDFQVAYNKEGAVIIGVDGLYGGESQGALQRVLDASSGGIAPAGCVGRRPSGGPPAPAGPPGAAKGAPAGGVSWASVAAVGGGILAVTAIVIAAATGYLPNPFK